MIQLFVFGIKSGRSLATWTGSPEEAPSPWEMHDALFIAASIVIIHEDGSLYGIVS